MLLLMRLGPLKAQSDCFIVFGKMLLEKVLLPMWLSFPTQQNQCMIKPQLECNHVSIYRLPSPKRMCHWMTESCKRKPRNYETMTTENTPSNQDDEDCDDSRPPYEEPSTSVPSVLFQASMGWCDRFQKTLHFCTISLHGEAGSADDAVGITYSVHP